MELKPVMDGVWWSRLNNKRVFATKNRTKGLSLFGEKLLEDGEYRLWEPEESKLAAAIRNNLKETFIKPDDIILYLGASTGTTTSYISDMLSTGIIFAVDSALRVVRDLALMAEKRDNIAPILCDANNTEELSKRICEVDYIYQDVSQRNQIQIFLKNIEMFLKPKGYAILCLKARSIDFKRQPTDIFKEAEEELNKSLTIVQKISLEPYQKGHMMFVCQN